MTSNPSNVTSLNSITKNKSAVVNTNTVTTSVSPTTTKDLRNAFVNAVETAIKTNKTNEPKAKSIIKSYMNALAADVAATAEVIKAKEELEAVAVETAAAAKVVTNAPGDTDAQNTYKEIAIELRYGALRKYIQEIISAFKKLKNKEEDPLWAWGDARTSSIPSNTEAVLRYLILDPYYANPEAEAMAAVAEAEYKRSEMPYDEVTKAVAEAEEAKKKVDEANKNTSPEELKTLKNGKAVSPPVPLPAVSVSLPVPLPALSVVKAAAITEGGRVISTVPGMLRHRTLKNTKVRGKTIKNRTLEKGRASARARTNKKLNSRQTPKKAINKVQHRTLKMEPDKVNTSKKPLLGGAPKKPMYNENTIRRFTDPIPSFPGKALTSAEKKMIEKLKEEIIKNEKK